MLMFEVFVNYAAGQVHQQTCLMKKDLFNATVKRPQSSVKLTITW
jgi:hypothetical protein